MMIPVSLAAEEGGGGNRSGGVEIAVVGPPLRLLLMAVEGEVGPWNELK